MKNLLIYVFVISFCIFIWSCSDDTTSPNNNGTGWPTGTITLNEVLPNWTYGTGYSLILYVYPSVKYQKTVLDSCPIGNNGNFLIHLPPLDLTYYDDSVNFHNVYCFDSVTIYPAILKTANTVFEIHKDGNIKGSVEKKVHRVGNDTNGTYYLKYATYSESGIMSGNLVCYTLNGSMVDTTVTIVNVNVNNGWNTMVSVIISKSYQKTVYGYSCFNPSLSTEWIYYMNKNQ